MGRLHLPAPAKVNFGLRIVGRRTDGYHELESLFLPLDLADEVEVQVAEAPAARVALRLEGAAPGVPEGAGNLCVRAAEGFLAEAGLGRRVEIRLRKRVPAAAGLGGGSSDAGAVLRALAHLLPRALDPSDLARLALGLGADVPFFLDPRPSLVSGIGERCEPLAPPWPGFPLLLVNPGTPLATGRVFEAYDALPVSGGRPDLPARVKAVGAAPGDPSALQALLENDLEGPARGLCPGVTASLEALRAAGALAAAMTGSGATVFGVFGSDAEARAAAGRVEPALGPEAWVRVARTSEAR